MVPVAKNKKVENYAEIENTSVDFNMLNYPQGGINTYDHGDIILNLCNTL